MSKKSALHINKGTSDAPYINPKWKGSTRSEFDIESLCNLVIKGESTGLSKAITLIESLAPKDKVHARKLMSMILPKSGGAHRIGISGVPGVGKSTFLESYCSHLLAEKVDIKIAILAVDPSSELTKGSILGDKTRMESIGKDPRVFIRPTASNGHLGGVAKSTYEAVALCEAAGYNYVFIETVGVGQSETVVSKLVDSFLFLAMPGTGDELQGIKKGIMEMADIIALNKCDSGREVAANQNAIELKSALQLVSRVKDHWQAPVIQISSLERKGMNLVEEELDKYYRHSNLKGRFRLNRIKQSEYRFEQSLGELLFEKLGEQKDWNQKKANFLEKVRNNVLTPFEASEQFIAQILD